MSADYTSYLEAQGDSSGRGFATGMQGEKALLACVLHRAIQDLTDKDGHERRLARNFFDCRTHSATGFSFSFICETLDLDKDLILTLLRDKGLLEKETYFRPKHGRLRLIKA